MATEKHCPKCGETKPAAQFYAIKSRSDGLSSYCRECQVRDTKARYNPHPRYRAPEGMKWCPRCQTMLSRERFGKNRSAHDGLQPRCKPCSVAAVTASRHKDPTSHRKSSRAWAIKNQSRVMDSRLRSTFGIGLDDYNRILEEQGGRCAICRCEPGGTKRGFHVDHCHEKGHVRGILCHHCNVGIGNFKNDPDVMRSAADYISRKSC